jgi:hypothetical protein
MEMRNFWTCEKDAQDVYLFEWYPEMENLANYQNKSPRCTSHRGSAVLFFMRKILPRNFIMQFSLAL